MTASARLLPSQGQPLLNPLRWVRTRLSPVINLPTHTKNGLGWTIDASRSGGETKTTLEILDEIDAGTLRAAQVHGETMSQIQVNRDRIATLLGLYEEWKRPDEVYADHAWEICIVWRSGYGRVEIGTTEDGSIEYYVSRTLSEKSEEASFRDHSKEELGRVMSWLEEMPEEA